MDGTVEIVVCDRGWVLVGVVTLEMDEICVTRGYVVRRWGTSQGLGELAARGPDGLSECILDPLPEAWRSLYATVIGRTGCVPGAWVRSIQDHPYA